MTISSEKIKVIITTMLSYLIWYILYEYFYNAISVPKYMIMLFSWLGILVIIYYFKLWHKITNKLFTIYNIFLMFFITFNFGQCLLWAFGIHTEKEIGATLLYGRIDCDNRLIVMAQIMFIICFITINCGAILVHKKKKKYQKINNSKIELRRNALFYASVILAIISVPITLYVVSNNYLTASTYGYKSLYYGEYVKNYPAYIDISTMLFMPSLIGLLIGSNYKKNIRYIVYIIFIIYAGISLLSGDRGEWIMKLIILFWADNQFYKKRNMKKMIILGIVAYLCLYIMNAIVSLRNVGISVEKVIEVLSSSENNPAVSLLTEFGYSMSVNITMLNEKVIFPYGNTYFMSILTMFATSISKLFGLEYVQLHTWFSSEYLRISYGADFSIIGEAIINYGVYLAPFIILILGAIISKITFVEKDKNNPLLVTLYLNISTILLKWPRTTTWIILNGICYSTIIMTVLYIVCIILIDKKKYKE